jgi:hypothetical protein
MVVRVIMGRISAAILAAAMVGIVPAAAGPTKPHATAVLAQAKVAAATEFSAQRKRARRRGPTRLRVTPLRRAYRQCVDWYALEYRPSGTVITPQMRCWWVSR